MKTIRTLLCMAFAVACGNPQGGATLEGRVDDGVGSQKQGLSSTELGGSGTVSAASKVRLMRLKADGSLELVTEATVKSGGAYELSAPAGEKKLIVQSLDASGGVRASAIVEQTGAEGSKTVVAPMSTESSVEAEVLAKLVASGVSLAEANAVDLRARIDADTAAAVRASSDAAARVKALAEAVAAAQRAQLKALAEAGVNTTQSALFDAQLAAAAKLNVALDAAADAAAAQKAYDDFVAELHAQAKQTAGDVKKASRGERAASVAFRATVTARLKVSGQALDPVADAAVRHAAGLEARLSTAATEAVLTAGGAASATMTAYASASTTLVASLRASTSAAATASAYATYRASLVGSGNVTASVLGSYLEVNAATQATVETAVAATVSAQAQLDTALTAAATASVKASQAIDFDAWAAAVVGALKTFDATVQTQAAALTGFGSKADVAVELMAQANGSLRIVEQ